MEANLVMQLKDKAQKIIPVPNEVSVIGRQKNCDFRIPLESISRRHCEVHCDNDSVVLRDLGSRNGTLLNGAKISNAERVLQPGDKIKIGPITFILQIDGQPNNQSLESQPPAPEAASSGTHIVIEEDGLGGDEFGDEFGDELGDSGDLDISDLDDLDGLDDLELDDI
jgi:pSer/pThr/pTyr-binding forkhead associated (FHA) protein